MRSSQELHDRLSFIESSEKKLSAEFIEIIKEFDVRKLYLDFGCTSLFQYLTERLSYTPASAQRRIESARLLRELPELSQDIKNGALNLTQASILARSVREKQKTSGKIETSKKREILAQIKNQDLLTSEKTICQMLNIAPKQHEKKHIQQDESIRTEVTFSKEEWALIQDYKNQISHVNPNPSLKDLMLYMVKKLSRKNVAERKQKTDADNGSAAKKLDAENRPAVENSTSESEAAAGQNPSYVPQPMRKQISQEQQCCQWKDIRTGKICGSGFQLQVDHIQPLWAGGDSRKTNLQLLCGVHNRLKYQLESGRRSGAG